MRFVPELSRTELVPDACVQIDWYTPEGPPAWAWACACSGHWNAAAPFSYHPSEARTGLRGGRYSSTVAPHRSMSAVRTVTRDVVTR